MIIIQLLYSLYVRLIQLTLLSNKYTILTILREHVQFSKMKIIVEELDHSPDIPHTNVLIG